MASPPGLIQGGRIRFRQPLPLPHQVHAMPRQHHTLASVLGTRPCCPPPCKHVPSPSCSASPGSCTYGSDLPISWCRCTFRVLSVFSINTSSCASQLGAFCPRFFLKRSHFLCSATPPVDAPCSPLQPFPAPVLLLCPLPCALFVRPAPDAPCAIPQTPLMYTYHPLAAHPTFSRHSGRLPKPPILAPLYPVAPCCPVTPWQQLRTSGDWLLILQAQLY